MSRRRADSDWRFTQEDVKPGLMWGAEVLQRIARQSRESEHRLLAAEKLAAIAFVGPAARPGRRLRRGLRNVLLTQHHDCWIVPYNGRLGTPGPTRCADGRTLECGERPLPPTIARRSARRRVGTRAALRALFNPTAATLDAVVPVPIPGTAGPTRTVSLDADGRRFPTQVVASDTPGRSRAAGAADGAAAGLRDGRASRRRRCDRSRRHRRESTSVPSSWRATSIGSNSTPPEAARSAASWRSRSAAASSSTRRRSAASTSCAGISTTRAASTRARTGRRRSRIVESGPLRATAEVAGTIAGHPFVQRVSITQASPLIDCSVRIDWRGNPHIGESAEKDGWRQPSPPCL